MRSSGDGMPARRSSAIAFSRACASRQTAMAHQHLDDLLADGVARIERGHRLLEDHRHTVAAQVAQLAVRQIEQARCRRSVTAPVTSALRLGQQAHHGERRHALAAAGLADQPERRAAREREVDAVDRDRAPPAVAVKHDAQVFDRQQRRGHHFASAASAAAMPASIFARSMHRRTGLRLLGRNLREMHPALAAHRFEPRELGERIGVVVDAQIEVGPLLLAVDQRARPTACRACRRRRLRPPSAPRSGGAGTAARAFAA